MSDPVLTPVGRVESPLTDRHAAPKQREGAPSAWLVFDGAVQQAIADLRVGDEVVVLTWLDRARRDELVVHPRDDVGAPLTGVFSTRSADRPNPIGLHQARLLEIDGLRVRVDRIEAVDGTPIVDVKPALTSARPRVMSWGELSTDAPGLAEFGADCMSRAPAYLATTRVDGVPRVHPVTPIIGDGRLTVFMEPTSPKGRDLRERGSYALHSAVPDNAGTGGEFTVSGRALPIDDPADRAAAARAASYEPAARYVLFELLVAEARCNGYGDVVLPEPAQWRSQ